MPKKYKDMTDEELDKLFHDAAENFRNSNPPEGAWETFYSSNQKKLAGEDAASMQPVAGRSASRVAFIKSYRNVAAILLLMVAGAAIVWFNFKKEEDRVNEMAVQTAISPVDTTIYSIPQSQQQSAALAGTLTSPPAHRSSLSPDLRSPDDRVAMVQTGFEGNGRIDPVPDPAWAPVASVRPVIPEKKESVAENNPIPKREPQRIDLARDQQQPSDKGNYTANSFLPTATSSSGNKGGGKWQLGIIGGSNLALIKGDISSTPGLNTGIMVQRRINDSRVSLESGVIYESMTYAVENEYFNPGGKPVSARVSNISGSCTMIDVPVNVRYDMVHSKKRKAFVSTGVSPTVMVQQSYVYDYTDETGTRLIDRDVTGQGKSLYAVANLSVGYEQKWNKTSLQVAPYLKIPMGEIGYGNLSLGGLGTQVSIKRDL